MKIERVNSLTFKLDDASYNTGDVIAKPDAPRGRISLYLKNGSFSLPIFTQKKWQDFTDAADAEFDDFEEASAYLAAAIASGDGVSSVLSDKGTVSQATSVTTAVTLNNLNGIISTFAQTAAADAQVTFTVNNSKVLTTSNILLSAIYPAANTGSPVVRVGAIAAGSFTVVITNVGTAVLNGANGTLKVGFTVL